MSQVRVVLVLIPLVLSALSDLRSRRIPDWLTLGGTAGLLALAFASSPRSGLLSLAAAALGLGVFVAVRALTRGKLGGGDAKLSMLMGAGLGPLGWYVAVCVSVAAALLFALAARRTRRPIVFAPFLALGACAALVVLAKAPAAIPGHP